MLCCSSETLWITKDNNEQFSSGFPYKSLLDPVSEQNFLYVNIQKNNVDQVHDFNLLVLFWFYWYFVLCVL